MTIRRLQRDDWSGFCAHVTRGFPGKRVDIEVASLQIGFQPEARRLPLIGISYDPKSDVLELLLGELDDLIVGKDRVLFAIVQVGGFLGIGSHFIAVPYSSLQINEDGSRIVLPGATREQVKGLPEFKYR